MNEAAVLEMVIRAREEMQGVDATVSRIKEMKKEMGNLSQIVPGHVKKMVSSVKKMKDSFVDVGDTMRTVRNQSLKSFTAIVAHNSISMKSIEGMKKQMSNFAQSLPGHVKKMVASVKKLKDSFVRLADTMRTVRNQALQAFTAIVALNSIPIKFYMDFQEGMSNVNTLLNVSRQELAQYSEGVIQVSNQIGESSKSLTNALYDIISAGVEATSSINVLELAGQAAKAGRTETQTSVNAGIAAINAYNLEISELGKVYDLQFSTVKKGVITFGQLAASQGQLIPSARKVNASLQSMYGSLAFLTKNGLGAEEASTSLARAFDALIEKQANFAELGIDVFDEATGKFRGMEEVAKELAVVMDGLSDSEQADIFEKLNLDVRAQRALIPMMKNLEGYLETVRQVSDSAGAMQQAYRNAIDNISHDWNVAKTNVINAIMGMGAAYEDEVRAILQNVTAWARAMMTFVDDHKDAIKNILKDALKLLSIITLFATIGSAVMALMTPMGAITAGVAVLAAAWYLNIGGIREHLEDFWKWLTTTSFEQKLSDIKTLLQTGWDWAINLVGEGWDWIKKFLPGEVVDVAEAVFRASLEFAGNTYEAIKKGFETGDWSEALGIAGDLWQVGATILVGLSLIETAKSAILASISGAFGGNASGVLSAGMIGMVSVGVALVDAAKEGNGYSYADFGADFVTALIAGIAVAGLTGSVSGGMLVFSATINLRPSKLLKDQMAREMEWAKENPNGVLGDWGQAKETEIKSWLWDRTPEWAKDLSESMKNLSEQYKDWRDRPGPKFATGGFVSGPGTGTSDSIPAMLSNGEFVINARATSQWLPLLEAINSGKSIDIPGFATGGLVGFADGGYVDVNMATLQSNQLGANEALNYLATISHDTEHFREIVELIAGIQNFKEQMQADLAALQEQNEAIKQKIQEDIDENSSTYAPSDTTWKDIVNGIGQGLEVGLREIASVMDDGWSELFSMLADVTNSLNSHEEGLSGAVSEIAGLFNRSEGQGFAEALNGLSDATVGAIAMAINGLKDLFLGWLDSNVQRQNEEFSEAVEQFMEAVNELTDSVNAGGSLGSAQSKYQEVAQKYTKAAQEYADAEEARRQRQAAGVGAGAGALAGAGIGAFFGPVGALIGGAIGGLVGAVGGWATERADNNDVERTRDEMEKYKEMMEEAREELAKAIEDSFGLSTQEFLANLNQDMLNAINNGEDLATAVGVSIFGQVKDSLQSVFMWAANDLIAQQLDPILQEAKDKIMSAITNGEALNFQNLMDIDQLIDVAKQAEQMAKAAEEMTEQYRQALRDAGIDEEIINQLFPEQLTEEQQRVATNLRNALKGAMSEALETGDLNSFETSLGKSIYNSAKDGLINAFMESAVYQEMFSKWFDMSGIEFTGDLSSDFATIQTLLDQLEGDLGAAGLGFGYTEMATAGNGASMDEGLYGSQSYFAPSTLEAGRDMAQMFADSIQQFVITTENLVHTLQQLIENMKADQPGNDKNSDNDLGQPVVKEVHYHYHFDPEIEHMYGDDRETVFKNYEEWSTDRKINHTTPEEKRGV